MSDDLSIPTDAPRRQRPPVPTELIAVPDDPEDPSEVIVRREGTPAEDAPTEWIAIDPDDLEGLQERR